MTINEAFPPLLSYPDALPLSDRGSQFTLLPTGEDFFSDIIDRIDNSLSSVDLQFYTFEADDEVNRVLQSCYDAASRGVAVRIMVDHLASNPRYAPATRIMHREVNATPSMEIRRAGTVRGMARIALRDHKKIVTIDGVRPESNGVAYIGGMNMTKRSLQWNDFMARIQGPTAQLIQEDFDKTWNGVNVSAASTEVDRYSETWVLTDTCDESAITPHVLTAIDDADDRVWLETPYFHMPTIGAALLRAKKRNPRLDARVIVPRFSNYPVDRLRVRRICSRLWQSGVQAYRYGTAQRRLNHTKLLIVDDMAVVGSSNFNAGILAGRNAEIAVATTDRAFVGDLEQRYEYDLKGSVK